jgi:virulence factor Mce-like protein
MKRTARPIAVLVAAAAVVLLWLALHGGSGYQLRVVLADADGLTTGSLVKVGGVSVGSVSSLRVTPRDQALAVVTLNHADAPVGRNARLYVRAADLLGEKYLDLQVGDGGRPAASGSTIPVTQTGEPVDLDQVLDVLDPTTRDRLAILTDEAGAALFGRGHNVSQILHGLPPTLVDVDQLLQQASANTRTLTLLLDQANSVVGTIDGSRSQLASLVTTASTALHATASRQAGLQATIADAPATLVQLRQTLGQLDTAGDALRPAARGLQSTAPVLTQTLKSLPGFTRAARPALAEVRSAAPFLRKLASQATPLVTKLRPTAVDLQTLSGDTDALTGSVASSIDDLLGTLQDWALAIQPRDAASHEFRVSVIVPPALISALLPIIKGTTPSSRPARRNSPTPAVTPAASPAPSSAAAPSGATHGTVPGVVGGVVSKLLGGVSAAGASVGATLQGTTKNLGGLLGYLLGR